MIFQIPHRHPVVNSLCLGVILLFSSLLSGSEVFAQTGKGTVAIVSDLSKDARLARDRGLIILLEFSSDSCGYCRLLEEEFLKPMSLDQEYSEKVIIRSIPMDGDQSFRGFKGELTSASEFASKYDVDVTPTMVFVDANGEEQSDKLVGIWSIDYFSSFIDERIDNAREKVL
jgi:thioredoxin-related protein